MLGSVRRYNDKGIIDVVDTVLVLIIIMHLHLPDEMRKTSEEFSHGSYEQAETSESTNKQTNK